MWVCGWLAGVCEIFSQFFFLGCSKRITYIAHNFNSREMIYLLFVIFLWRIYQWHFGPQIPWLIIDWYNNWYKTGINAWIGSG